MDEHELSPSPCSPSSLYPSTGENNYAESFYAPTSRADGKSIAEDSMVKQLCVPSTSSGGDRTLLDASPRHSLAGQWYADGSHQSNASDGLAAQEKDLASSFDMEAVISSLSKLGFKSSTTPPSKSTAVQENGNDAKSTSAVLENVFNSLYPLAGQYQSNMQRRPIVGQHQLLMENFSQRPMHEVYAMNGSHASTWNSGNEPDTVQ